ncbi:large subunit ribosomal protein img2 [Cyclospora cayetanensis]|uniref:Large ribosomal subunit protein mL49 n=1 Tax=Cyclospora cayetanensis TaxID=88456 RepID=A0A1D3D0N0_9EIME|nr:large subunit ribosomal protein img2 [Cyclospora cayetanensis]
MRATLCRIGGFPPAQRAAAELRYSILARHGCSASSEVRFEAFEHPLKYTVSAPCMRRPSPPSFFSGFSRFPTNGGACALRTPYSNLLGASRCPSSFSPSFLPRASPWSSALSVAQAVPGRDCWQPLHSAQSIRCLVEVKFRRTGGKDTSGIPFKVLRTPSGNLPVYSRIRKHGTAVTTIIRHAMGDITALKKDLMAICEAPVREREDVLDSAFLLTQERDAWADARETWNLSES